MILPDYTPPWPHWRSPDGTCLLIQGDCLEVLESIRPGDVQCMIVDPPYGIAFGGHGQWFRKSEAIQNDDSARLAEALVAWCRGQRLPLAMFFSPFKPLAVDWRSVLVWDKGAHVGIGGDRKTCWKRDFELIGVRDNLPLTGQRDSAVLRFSALLPPPTGHVAEKPVPLLTYLVEKLSCPGATICDPCMGSGSTVVAAGLAKRRTIGIEIDPRYYEIAVSRVRAAYTCVPPREAAAGQLSLLAHADR